MLSIWGLFRTANMFINTNEYLSSLVRRLLWYFGEKVFEEQYATLVKKKKSFKP